MLTFFDVWLPYIYLYGAGGIFFIIGLLITKKAGAMNLNRKYHRYWFKVLIFGFIWFMMIHFILIIAALYW
jgi:hypothetical protein